MAKKKNPAPAKPVGFYDKKAAEEHSRKFESVEEAITICFTESKMCTGTRCQECPMYMYGTDCENAMINAKDFLEAYCKSPGANKMLSNYIYGLYGLLLGLDNDGRYSSDLSTEECCNNLYEDCTKLVQNLTGITPAAKCSSRCETCKHLREISGIPFCHAWHNFTIPEGYCYLYSGTMENEPETVQAPVDNQTKYTGNTQNDEI